MSDERSASPREANSGSEGWSVGQKVWCNLQDLPDPTLTMSPIHREVYTAMVAVGNQQGLLGLGVADAATAQDAVAKAHMDSYSNLQFVPLYRGHTIFHRIDHDFHRMKVR